MATNAFDLVGRIIIQGGDQAQSQLQGLNNEADRGGGLFGKLGGAMVKFGAIAATAVGGVAIAVGTMGVKYNAALEQSQVAWETLLGSQEKATAQLKRISDFAKTTQFDTANVDAMAKYMTNAGLAGDALFKELGKVADVAGAFAIPAADAKEMARQMSQVRQAGVAYTEDLNILQDKGIPIFTAIAKVTGTNTAEVKKMASEGKISADIYLKAFDSVAKGVEGASAKQSQTFSGMISTLQDNLSILAGALSKPLFDLMKQGLEKLMPVIDKFVAAVQNGAFLDQLTAALKWFGDNADWIVASIGAIVGALVAFQVIMAINKAIAMFNLLMSAYRAGVLLATVSQLLFNSALLLNPFTWIAIAIGVLIAAVIMLVMHWDTVRAFFVQLWADITAIFFTSLNAVVTFLSGIWTSITNAVMTAWNAIVAWITPVLNGLKTTFEIIFFALFYVVYTILEKIWSIISPYVMPIVNFIVEKFTWLKDQAAIIWGIISAKIAEVLTAIKATATSVITTIVNWIANQFAWISGKISEIWNGIKNNIEWVFGLIGGVVTKGVNAIKQPFLDLVTPIYNIGKDIINGLINGISDMWGSLKKSITDIANKGKSLFTSIFGIKSPSKFTTYIGAQLGEGLTVGLDKSEKGVLGSAKGLATNALDALQSRFSPSMNMGGANLATAAAGAAMGGGGAYTVEIPVVLNGREIARAVAPDIDQELERNRKVTARARGTV